MSATFGGYGLPLNGSMPAALAGGDIYALDDANTKPAAGDTVGAAPPPPEEVLTEDGLVKARRGGARSSRSSRSGAPAGRPLP
jgi:hypothetical protein